LWLRWREGLSYRHPSQCASSAGDVDYAVLIGTCRGCFSCARQYISSESAVNRGRRTEGHREGDRTIQLHDGDGVSWAGAS
jgi:hypothetical protein